MSKEYSRAWKDTVAAFGIAGVLAGIGGVGTAVAVGEASSALLNRSDRMNSHTICDLPTKAGSKDKPVTQKQMKRDLRSWSRDLLAQHKKSDEVVAVHSDAFGYQFLYQGEDRTQEAELRVKRDGSVAHLSMTEKTADGILHQVDFSTDKYGHVGAFYQDGPQAEPVVLCEFSSKKKRGIGEKHLTRRSWDLLKGKARKAGTYILTMTPKNL